MGLKSVVKDKIRSQEKFRQFIFNKTKAVDAIYMFAFTYMVENKFLQSIIKGKTIEVLDGPFKGMRYASARATGSALGLKLCGIYEEELLPVIAEIIEGEYKKILDIGSAEGYYAVGLARVISDVKVDAYDIDPYARELLNQMCEINEVSDRVAINGWCTKEILRQHDYTDKTLIISDCEGYEKELFDEDSAEFLSQTDILIEVHDNLDTEKRPIFEQIERAFSKTHDIEVIYSMKRFEKVAKHCNKVLFKNTLTDRELEVFMDEREWNMVWVWMKGKG